jgi:hypothetical protein
MDKRKIISITFFVTAVSLLHFESLSGKPLSPVQSHNKVYCSLPLTAGNYEATALNFVDAQRELNFRTHRGLQEDSSKIFAYLIISLGTFSPNQCGDIFPVTTLFVTQCSFSFPSLRSPPSLS